MSDQPCKVLIVDDNADSANSAALLLRLEGHEVDVAYEPRSALDKVRAMQPDVVLMDVALPGRTGIDLGKDIRSLQPKCRMIVVTGFTRADIERSCHEAGFNGYLIKPTPPKVLAETVQEQCEQAQACDCKQDSP